MQNRIDKPAGPGHGSGGFKIKPKYIITTLLVGLALAAVLLLSREPEGQNDLVSYNYLAMDTVLEMRFTPAGELSDDELFRLIVDEVERLEALLCRYEPGSDVSVINSSAGQEPIAVSPEALTLIGKALHFAEISDGAFDPTIAPLTDAWGFWEHTHRVPDHEELSRALELVDYKKVKLDIEEGTVFLPREEMALELGGIAKGFIVDRALEVLSAKGATSAFINAGGDIGLIGTRPDGEPWRIGIGHPREEGSVIAVIPMSGGAVVTSGDYRRFFEEDGVRYHHIIDPASGFPAGDLISVTISAPTVVEADALSTAIFVLGPEKGMALVEKLPLVEGILIGPDLEIYVSSGLEGIVELRL